ncbi:hypothetical protein SNEBB_005531 [Seison nebaliae]|nr:hypothetical protein SNEBB_005531 [Seison nebaliae]
MNCVPITKYSSRADFKIWVQSRGNDKLVLDEKYSFYKRKTYVLGSTAWTCSERKVKKCKVTICLSDENKIKAINHEHCHDPDELAIKKLKMKEELSEACKAIAEPPVAISRLPTFIKYTQYPS